MIREKNCIVLGGAGDVGEGIVRQLRRAGHKVAVPSRARNKLDALAAATEGDGELIGINASIGDPAEALRVAQDLRHRMGTVDLIVASIGSWWTGPPLLEMDGADWNNILQGSITSHFIAARAFLPLVRETKDGQYIFINGGAARFPVPGSGPISIAAVAQEMMKNVLAGESKGHPVSITTVMLMTMIKTRSRTSDNPEWISADDVGHYLVRALATPLPHGETIMLHSPGEARTA